MLSHALVYLKKCPGQNNYHSWKAFDTTDALMNILFKNQ